MNSRNIALKIKSFQPAFLLNFLRGFRIMAYQFVDYFYKPLKVMKYCGFLLYYFKGSGLNYRIRAGNPDRIYERELCESIVKTLKSKPNSIFLDVGSNIGLISLYVASKIPQVKIFAFEPGPKQSAQFAISLYANNLEGRVSLVQKAVNDSLGMVKFFTTELVDGTSDGMRDTGRSTGLMKEIFVEAITLDGWWQQLGSPKVGVIKLDIEGQELRALKGARLLLEKDRPVVFLEILTFNLENGLSDALKILEWLNQNNYLLYTSSGRLCNEQNMEECLKNTDSYEAKPQNPG